MNTLSARASDPEAAVIGVGTQRPERNPDRGVGLGRIERLRRNQSLGQALELVAVAGEQGGDGGMGFSDDALDLLVDEPLSAVTSRSRQGEADRCRRWRAM
jgi:hypothetical protein